MAVTVLQVKNHILANARVYGNSNYGLREICSDLVNNYGANGNQLARLSEGTFLSVGTLKRMATLSETELGDPYKPSEDTCKRILNFFGAEIYFKQVQIKPAFANKPKS